MPYIPQEDREELDPSIDNLAIKIKELTTTDTSKARLANLTLRVGGYA